MRKRKVTYPPSRTDTRQPRPGEVLGGARFRSPTVAEINLGALDGRDDISVGDRVRIGGGGLYAGEVAVVESVISGLIPAATVRTDSGRTRRVRAVDLERLTDEG